MSPENEKSPQAAASRGAQKQNEISNDHYSGSGPEKQRRQAQEASEIFLPLLAGELNGRRPVTLMPESLGPWYEHAKVVWDTYQDQGLEAARRTFATLAKADPALGSLLSQGVAEVDPLDTLLSELKGFPDVFAPRKPRRYLVAGILPTPSLTIWYAAPGVGKSLLAADLSMAVITGKPWLQNKVKDIPGIATSPGSVLWIDLDNGPRRTAARFEAIARAYDVDPTPGGEYENALRYLSMPTVALELHTSEGADLLRQLVIKLRPDLVVIDTFVDLLGGVDENSPETARSLQNLRGISEADGHECAIAILHHPRKGGQGASSGQALTLESLRGSGAIAGKMDAAFAIWRSQEDKDLIVISSTKDRDLPTPTLGARLFVTHKADPHGDEMELAYYEGETVETPKARKERDAREAILTVLKYAQEPPGQDELIHEAREYMADELGYEETAGNKAPLGIIAIRDLIRAMAEEGEILRYKAAGKNKQLHRLPPQKEESTL